MPTTPRSFSDEICYHVYNCGVEKRITFTNDRDYQRFLEALTFYLHNQKIPYSTLSRLSPAAQAVYFHSNPPGSNGLRTYVLAYCLMPNHFHFILKQAKNDGIKHFISDITNSYTKYFNTKYERIGNLFQGTFKAKPIESEEALLQLSRYIHLNPSASSKVSWKRDLSKYPYSSYGNWVKRKSDSIVNIKKVEELVDLPTLNYNEFVESKVSSPLHPSLEKMVIESDPD